MFHNLTHATLSPVRQGLTPIHKEIDTHVFATASFQLSPVVYSSCVTTSRRKRQVLDDSCAWMIHKNSSEAYSTLAAIGPKQTICIQKRRWPLSFSPLKKKIKF